MGNISVIQQENGWQPRRGASHDYPNDISVIPDFTSTLSIYGAPGGARRALASELTSPGSERLRLINVLTAQPPNFISALDFTGYPTWIYWALARIVAIFLRQADVERVDFFDL